MARCLGPGAVPSALSSPAPTISRLLRFRGEVWSPRWTAEQGPCATLRATKAMLLGLARQLQENAENLREDAEDLVGTAPLTFWTFRPSFSICGDRLKATRRMHQGSP